MSKKESKENAFEVLTFLFALFVIILIMHLCSGCKPCNTNACANPNTPKTYDIIEVTTLTYPAHSFVCKNIYWSTNPNTYRENCGMMFHECTEKDTEDYYDSVACVPALVRFKRIVK